MFPSLAADQPDTSSSLTPTFDGSSVFGQGDGGGDNPSNPILDIMRQNSNPTTSNDMPHFTPSPQPQMPMGSDLPYSDSDDPNNGGTNRSYDKNSDPYYRDSNYGQPANTDPAYGVGFWGRINDQVGNNLGAQIKLSMSAAQADAAAHKLAKETGQPFKPSPPGLVAGSGDMGLSDEQVKNITADDWKYKPEDWQDYSRPGTQSPATSQSPSNAYTTPTFNGSPVFGQGGGNAPTYQQPDNTGASTQGQSGSYYGAGNTPASPDNSTGTLDNPDTSTRPRYARDSKGKKIKSVGGLSNPPPPDPPMPGDDEVTTRKKILAQLRYDQQYPVDKNHGFKSRLGEVLQNFFTGVSNAPQGSGVLGMLGAGGAGAVTGVVDKTTNERMKAERKIPQAEKDVQTSIDQAHTQAQTTGILQKPVIEADKQAALTKRSMARDVIRQYNALPEFDPDDPDNAAFIQTAKEAGIVLPRKDAKTSYKYITNAATGRTYVDVSDKAGNRHLEEVLNDDGTSPDITTPQMMTAAEKKEQRELQERLAKEKNITTIKSSEIAARSRKDVANIGAGSRKDVANINQAGALDRTNITQQGKAANEDANRREKLRQWVIKTGTDRTKFAAGLASKVQLGHMSQADADRALADFDATIQQ